MGLYADHTVTVLVAKDSRCDLRFILGVPNSTPLNFVFAKRHIDIHIKGVHLAQLPIPAVDSVGNSKFRGTVVELVTRVLALVAEMAAARSSQERERLEREAATVDQRIDRIDCDLYGLTDDEVAVVESNPQWGQTLRT